MNRRVAAAALLAVAALTSCSSGGSTKATSASSSSSSGSGTSTPSSSAPPADAATVHIYAHDRAGSLSTEARAARSLVYVPDSASNRVDVIDPTTYKIVDSFPVAREPQHVVPSWDLKTLWVNSDLGNSLMPIDPRTGRHGKAIKVDDPYNLYFTPDGRHALVMAERLRRIDVRDPHTMRLQWSVHVPCRGVNHADFTADGKWMVASCEFSGKLLVVPLTLKHVASVIDLNGIRTPKATSPRLARAMGGPAQSLDRGASAMPQDVRITDDGRTFVVADMLRNGVWLVDAATRKVSGFVPTGPGAHGIYPSRDATRLFVSNRDGASITVLDATGHHVLATWPMPKGASPDMGGVSVDGKLLWLSGRYDSKVYVIDTTTGRTVRQIKVGAGPHGLAVWPQPGRHSMGHTGNMR